jgi:fused signal recognition particle receptor
MEKAEAPAREGFVRRLRARLNRGDSWLTYDLARLVPGGKIDEEVLEELETALIMADVGVDATADIIARLEDRLARKDLKDAAALLEGLRTALVDILHPVERPLEISEGKAPFVILMVGVNGAGKTTRVTPSCSLPVTRFALLPSSNCRHGASATRYPSLRNRPAPIRRR